MPIAQIAAGRSMLVSPGVPALWQPLGAAATPGYSGATPLSVVGCTGWWDASFLAHCLDSSQAPLPVWGAPATYVLDQSPSNTPLRVYHSAATGTSPQATPRLNGTLGGLGSSLVTPPTLPAPGTILPQLDPDTGFSLPAASLGSGNPWTVYLVWSRPNYVQGSGSPSSIVLMSVGSVPLLGADATVGANTRLLLYPGSSQVVLSSSLSRRHTHAVIIRNTPGTGVDVWLDGVQVVSAYTNPSASSVSGSLLFLHSGQTNGAAQCWFHEAAIYNRALSSANISSILTYQSRWTLGTRKGIQLFVVGQSNCLNGYNWGAWHLLAQGAAYYAGALAYGVIGGAGDGATNYTMIGGHGITNEPLTGTVVYPGSFLEDPEDGSDPSGWSLGADGNATELFLSYQSVADKSDIALMVWPWTETESTRAYGEKAFILDAKKNLAAKLRAYLGRTASNLPWMLWNAIPFGSGSNGGIQMIREVDAALAADSTQGAFIGWPQTSDSNPINGVWDPTTGVFSNGGPPPTADYNHRDPVDMLAFGRRGAVTAGAAIIAAEGGDTIASYPAGVPKIGGPVISRVVQTTAYSTTLTLTITHDAGTDLIVPLLAASGQGFVVMDGGSTASPGNLIAATACMRIDATHLQITLASAPTNTQDGLLLFYPYGYGNIFRGDAVTDNYASVVKPPGWDIGADLGSAWMMNYPLAATTTPLPVFSTP